MARFCDIRRIRISTNRVLQVSDETMALDRMFAYVYAYVSNVDVCMHTRAVEPCMKRTEYKKHVVIRISELICNVMN